MIDLILYTGLFFASLSIGGLAYGLLMKKAEQIELVRDKTIKQEPNIRKY